MKSTYVCTCEKIEERKSILEFKLKINKLMAPRPLILSALSRNLSVVLKSFAVNKLSDKLCIQNSEEINI